MFKNDVTTFIDKRARARKVVSKIWWFLVGLVTLLLLASILTGCGASEAEIARARSEQESLRKKESEAVPATIKASVPIVRVAVEYDGCIIKHVDFIEFSGRVYIAKCGSTQTITHEFRVGKRTETKVSIMQQIEELQKKKAEEELKELALQKLTDEEKAVLFKDKQ